MHPVILSAVRTPVGKFLGGLADVPAPKLGGYVLAEAAKRANIPLDRIDEVILGQVVQAGVGQAPARQAALAAGFPVSVPAVTVNKVCGSGLKAIMQAAQAIKAGDADIVLAGGMESMSRAPFLLPNARGGYKYGDQTAVDSLIKDGLWCATENWAMGCAADHTAKSHGITRQVQDAYAVESHKKAAAAWAAGAFDAEVLPVTVGTGPKATTVAKDEGVRPDSNLETLARLKPAFGADGTVTAGNASTLNDGAAAVVVASSLAAEQLGVKPLARILAYASSGVAPKEIFTAPVSAVRLVLQKAKLNIGDIDLFELNEAFAAQMLACGQELGLDPAKVNVHGGAVALGHPIGASGARVLVTLLHALQRHDKRFGLASLCLGGGNAVAMVVERVG